MARAMAVALAMVVAEVMILAKALERSFQSCLVALHHACKYLDFIPIFFPGGGRGAEARIKQAISALQLNSNYS